MRREFIKSQTISSVGYDPVGKILEIEFVNKTVYRYLSVPKSIYLTLLSANSKGAYFNRRIRDRFVCRKIK